MQKYPECKKGAGPIRSSSLSGYALYQNHCGKNGGQVIKLILLLL